MKTITCLLTLLLWNYYAADAQLVPCRPKIAMVYYAAHDDRVSNPDMTAIIGALPDILIDNTHGGLWKSHTVAGHYTAVGIQVFTYITGGYEGTRRGGDTALLAANLLRVDSIALDTATGVFMDEVSTTLNTAAKAYISAIYNRCQVRGLKLILNPGTYSFDTFLISHSNYIMTDEQYHGRAAMGNELLCLDSILVVNNITTTAGNAADTTTAAARNGFGFSYACSNYLALPPWLTSYMTLATGAPDTPTISLSGSVLSSDAPYGNQWYGVTLGLIPGATGRTFVATGTDTYYDIVKLYGCSSDTSNLISYINLGIAQNSHKPAVTIYPNPSTGTVTISHAAGSDIVIYDVAGKAVFHSVLKTELEVVDISALQQGVYMMQVTDKAGVRMVRRMVKK